MTNHAQQKNQTWQRPAALLAGAVLLLLSLPVAQAGAQLTGQVDLEQIGVSFTIPDRWVGQLDDQAFVMGGQEEPGLILMVLHEFETLEEIRREAGQGIDDGGIKLRLDGELEAIGDQALGGAFQGTIEGSPARVYMVATLNPHGEGVTIMAMTDEANYSERYRELARQVAASLVFTAVETPPLVQQAQQMLTHTRLNYLSSYSSGSAGGTSSRRHMDLCPDGRFSYQSSSSLTVDTGGAFGSSFGSDDGTGTWAVVPSGAGQVALELRFDDGRVWSYELSFQDGSTYLDGTRYFRIGPNDPNGYGPRCR